MSRQYEYLFGPVPSRRLGRSLGVDLVPFKTCSFDCIFCQLGRTTNKTITREEYVPVQRAIDELANWIDTEDTADYITLSGSGEPTLNSNFGRLIEFARNKTTIPVAVLTNGSLLTDPEVREQVAQANVVKVTLSAWDQFSYKYINRPHPDIGFKKLIEGLWLLRKRFDGELWVEVFLVWGANTTTKDLSDIAELTKTIGPDRVQLNTAVRPPCEDYVLAVPPDRMKQLVGVFDPPAEIIAEYSADVPAGIHPGEAEILAMVKRRPCTLEQICEVFGLHRNEAAKYLGKLTRSGLVERPRRNTGVFYAGKHSAAEEAPC